MLKRLISGYERINPRRTPENSLALRLSVLAAVIVSEITILAMGYYSAPNIIAVPLLTLAGFSWSWRSRQQRNLLLKAFLSLLVIAVSVLFIRELANSFYDTRIPLIKLLLWLQVLHSFDVPARRDLKFSLASGLTLIAAGAVLSTGMAYIIGMASFSLAAVIALVFFNVSEESQRSDQAFNARPVQMVSFGVAAWVAAIALAVPLLLAMPQSGQARLHSLPLSGLQNILGDFTADVVNPNYSNGDNPFDHPPQFNANSYYGFNPYMDLRSRGNLSDDIVLKVRSDGYDYYRGIVFDRYNGKGWEMGNGNTVDISTDTSPFNLDLPSFPASAVRTKIQTFYVQTEMPNIIFSTWKPDQLFFPANRIKMDDTGSLRSPFPLTDDTVYSVIVEQPLQSAATLSHFPRPSDPAADSRYTDLPGNDDLLAVARLAAGVTAASDSRFGKAMAIERYLKENYTYDLDVPPQEQEKDAVSYFLFDVKRGYCEHFASSMAVMARSVGIPARVVTGYGGGSYNPFTGLWEIRQSDAHAWVEIYFGSAGWVPFDPTPGFDVPSGQNQSQGPWLAGRIFSYLGTILGSGPVGGALAYLGGGLKGLIALALALPLVLTTVLTTGILAVIWGGRSLLRRYLYERRRRQLVAGNLDPAYPKEAVLSDYFDLALRLQRRGLLRGTDETLREFARRVSNYLNAAEFAELSALVERLRYQEIQLPEMTQKTARELARRVAVKIEDREAAPKPATGLS